MEAIGSISNMVVPNYEWTPILYKKGKKWSELIKDEKELLFHGKLDIINNVLTIASKFTGLDENVLLNIDNDLIMVHQKIYIIYQKIILN